MVRLFTSVGAGMDSQGTPLDETLSAAIEGALVRSLVGVYPVVSLQIRLPIEALADDGLAC